ncbi:MAG: hypothetical protein ACFFCS_04545 [Candidatus Hodarchaeota archaeon]
MIFAKPDPIPDMHGGIVYELFAIAISLITMLHCYKKRGKWDTIKIYVIGMLYGLVLENGGPMEIPFLGLTGYFWEENFQIYLFEFFGYGYRVSLVPMATHLGWPMVFYLAVVFWEQIYKAFPKIKQRIIISGLIMTSSGLLFDLAVDVIAARFNWWVWNDNLLPIWFGVPLINYLAWFWAVMMFGWFWAWFHNKPDWDDKKITKWLAICVPTMWLLDTVGFMSSKLLLDLLGLIHV